MPDGINIPLPKHILVKALILKSKFIIIWIAQQFIFRVLEIKSTVPAYWHASEKDIKSLIHDTIIELCSRKGTEESIVENWEDIEGIFPELKEHHVAVPSVSLSSVNKHKVFEESELAD